MKTSTLLLASLSVMLCSCGSSPSFKISGVGDDPTWISCDETLRVAEQLLTNRYPQAQIVWLQGDGQTWTYRFATNGTVSPEAVVVDRKKGKAKFENARH
jgi:hypothetical protein